MSKLKMAVVGTGGIWNLCHANVLLEHPDIEIVAACDIVKSKAQKFAKAHGIKHVFADYRDLLKLKGLDYVDICTPNLYHSEIAVAALKAGKHVFCEKPDAVNPVEAQKMADAAKKSGKTLMVMRNNRFAPGSRYLKKFIDAGKMGEIYTGRCGWQRRRGSPGKGGWFTTKALSGGGPLIDLGVHMIDLAIWLMGDPVPLAVSGCTYRKFADSAATADSANASFGEAKADGTYDVEDLAIGFIKFDNGASLQIEFSWDSNVEQEVAFVELRGTKSGAALNPWTGVKIFSESEGGLYDIHPKLVPNKIGDHGMMIHHFIDVLQGKAKPIIKPEHGVNMIKILSAIYESANTGREVRLG